MDRIRWSENAISFRSLVNNIAIQKPVLVQIGTKAIIVGEKINGEFIMASPCKVSGDRFDVIEEELILSSKHTGLWRVISRTTSKNEDHIHRLTTKDIERIHRQDSANERSIPRSYICIRDIEAFELVLRHQDDTIYNGHRIDRRMKQIEENVEFEIIEHGEVEYTPSEGERTSQDYVIVPKSKQGVFLQLLLPGVVEQEQVIRNRVIHVLHCRTLNETRKRHFLLEINELPSEIRPIASEGSTELRYIHSTQNLYDYMLSYGNDTVLFVKLLRGDPPLKAVEFDGYMVLKSTLNGDKIPICRVEDLEITLVNPDLPVRVRLPTRSEHSWHSLSEVRAAEVQCMQLSLALLARHESEMYVSRETQKNMLSYSKAAYNQEHRSAKSRHSSDAVKKHLEECEKVFGNNKSKTNQQEERTRKSGTEPRINLGPYRPGEAQIKPLVMSNNNNNNSIQKHKSASKYTDQSNSRASKSSYPNSDKSQQKLDRRATWNNDTEQDDSYNRSHRTKIK